MQAVLGLDALVRDARADHFGEAVDVERVHGEALLDLAAHRLGPRLRPADADLQRTGARIEALALELVGDRQQVGRRDHDDVRPEIVDQLDLALGHAAGHRHHRAVEPLRAVVRAEPASEQSVAVHHVDDITGAAAGRLDAARAHLRPHLDVAPGIADHGGLASRAGRRVDTHDLPTRHREHVERIVPTQVVLGGERELAEVGEIAQIVGVHASPLERLPVMRDPIVGVAQGRLEPGELQRRDFVARSELDPIEVVRLGRARSHAVGSVAAGATTSPRVS
jgi:hypothetical protein